MYSKKRIEKVLEKFSKREGWTPVPHSMEEVEEFTAYVKSIIKIGRNAKASWIESVAPLTSRRIKEIGRWIANEQALCAIDSAYFESRYVYVSSEGGETVKFQNRESQETLEDAIADLEDRNLPVELIINSERQSGISTKMILNLINRALFVPDTTASFITPIRGSGEFTKDFIRNIYDKLPFWLPPIPIKTLSFANNSKILILASRSIDYCVQGLTPSVIYISNADLIECDRKHFENVVVRSVHSHRNTLFVIHGDKGNTGWFGAMFQEAKQNDGKHRFHALDIGTSSIPQIEDVDYDALFPQPINMQEAVVRASKGLALEN